jgi:transcriptional regulator with XRE-family HTH domain
VARIIEGKNQNIIGSNIRKIRMEKHMSQKRLSDRLELFAVYVCRGSISRIEGRTRTVSDIEVLGFSQALDVPMERLFVL